MTNYQCEHFQIFCDVVKNTSITIIQDWGTNLNNSSKKQNFNGWSQLTSSHFQWAINDPTCRDVIMASIRQMNGQCFDAIEMLVIALEKRFQNYDLTNAFGHYVCTILNAI
jgi:hypothetical protein